ncbi:hypothetical protein [Streptomyces poriticola]|uniref:hypothetical protein n=1 Tax=Streptomyces poriticola TaxID=3120506 RepID=UPI002FCE0AC7
MQMTEPFAATTAAVAPVILLVAAIEVAAYQKAVRDWVSGLTEQLEPELRSLQQAPPEVRSAAQRRLLQDRGTTVGAGILRLGAQFYQGLFWSVITVGQVWATVYCLAWLADPDQPRAPEAAGGCLAAVGIGALAVAAFPVYRLLGSPLAPVAERMLEAELRKRLAGRGDGAAGAGAAAGTGEGDGAGHGAGTGEGTRDGAPVRGQE